MPVAGAPAPETTVVYKTAGQPAVRSERVNSCTSSEESKLYMYLTDTMSHCFADGTDLGRNFFISCTHLHSNYKKKLNAIQQITFHSGTKNTKTVDAN